MKIIKKEPLLPDEYKRAITALVECTTFEEAKYWSDASQAAEAWAKIYNSKEVMRKARQLNLHAYRRIGELAHQINPIKPKTKGSGATPYLRSMGMSYSQACAAAVLGKTKLEDFQKAVNLPTPPTPITFVTKLSQDTSKWAYLKRNGLGDLRVAIQRVDAFVIASQMDSYEADSARDLIKPIIEWLDDFDMRLKARVECGEIKIKGENDSSEYFFKQDNHDEQRPVPE